MNYITLVIIFHFSLDCCSRGDYSDATVNALSSADRAKVMACLVEGNSIRATVRMTGIAKNAVAKLLVDLGHACTEYQDKIFRNLKLGRIQCDEIWSFCGAKEKNARPEQKAKGCGDV
jgi:hypothetical protein